MTVSRRHARIDVRDGGWVVADLRSANGTLVNGWRVLDEATVRPGDRLTFGAITYRLGPPLRS
jgi:pSer/pThr/pTyr-binding forkhead associated (FHA) protein